MLQFLHVLDLAGIHAVGAGGLAGVGQQVAVLVDDGHIFGGQFGHAAGHQMHDGADLLRVEHAAGVKIEQHRRGGHFLLGHKNRVLGHGQVDARGLHGGDRFNRTRQFAFHGALEIDVFDKLGRTEFLVFQQLKADIAAFGQALRGQLQAGIVNAVSRHQHCAAAF